MRCSEAGPLLSGHIDDTLTARQALELGKHLAECNGCARLSHELRRTVALAAAAPRAAAPDGFVDAVHARIARRRRTPTPVVWATATWAWVSWRRGPVMATALALTLAVALLSTGQGPPDVERAPEPHAVQAARSQSVALAAADPLEDIAAANLAAQPAADPAPAAY
ncbi:MAG: zf-HC2 domain-containing protein [Chthonomonadales bacterium]|nr:zf-HC2 domain-containing protein [Chthonomonadales bacterium]